MTKGYIGLGSNLGDRKANLQRALELLTENRVEILRVSDFIVTKPFGVTDQPDFLNGVVEIAWEKTPEELLDILLKVERDMGRIRQRHWGERNIDLDLLLLGDAILTTPSLTLPHPGIAERAFVLEPLFQLAPKLMHPVKHKTISQLWADLRKGE